MSTISTSTTTTTGYVVTSDTTGTLVIQTGATPTTAVTVNGSGAIGVGSSPSYGTSGQVLTSGGSGVAPTWASVTAGDVSGPASATANGLALFNSTTGKLIKDSAASDGLIYGLTIGRGAGAVSTNTVFGASALASNTVGVYNTAVGQSALTASVNGDVNDAFGRYALRSNTSGSYNKAFGAFALELNTSGSNNVAMGDLALGKNTTASNNTAVGYQALAASTTAASNVAVGANALKSLQTTNSNVAVGESAGTATTTGYENVFIGSGAGSNNTTGYFNVFIGNKAGQNNGPTTGSTNTIIGNDARVTASNSNTQLVVAARQSATAKGDNTGFIDGGTGGIYQGNNSSSWSTTSDFRLKKNIVDNTQGLDIISQVRVRNFEYRTAEEVTELPEHTVVKKEGVQLGVIAQELQQVCSDCVKIETTGVMSVDSDNLFWHMVNAIKDLKALIDAQAVEIAELKGNR